jgi:hypothetical protein
MDKRANTAAIAGRSFVSSAGNVCKFKRLADGALEGVWKREPTAADIEEANEWIGAIANADVTSSVGIENQAADLARFLRENRGNREAGMLTVGEWIAEFFSEVRSIRGWRRWRGIDTQTGHSMMPRPPIGWSPLREATPPRWWRPYYGILHTLWRHELRVWTRDRDRNRDGSHYR